MPGTSSPRSFFTKTSEEQNSRELLEEGPAFRRAKFWFWPIVISVTLFFGFFAGIRGHLLVFSTGLLEGGFFSMKVLRRKKSENTGRAKRDGRGKNVFFILNKISPKQGR